MSEHQQSKPGASALSSLTPGGGTLVFEQIHQRKPRVTERYAIYRALESIKAATRSRAVDHWRSAVRDDTPITSAVSDVEKPAK